MAVQFGSARRRVLYAICLVAICSILAGTVYLSLGTTPNDSANNKPAILSPENLPQAAYDPTLWGLNFPLQYESFMKTTDSQRTRYGGSEAFPRIPTNADPRTSVAKSKLDHEPALREIWAGHAFADDYREKRGHAYMLDDQTSTERQKVGQPGACINCHSSAVEAYVKLGQGDYVAGFEKLNAMPFFEARKEVNHPIGCVDCHDPGTMALRITRPAFMNGIAALKALEGIENYDVNKMATHEEMRSYVCGQCHVEYYFSKENKRLEFPWHKGPSAENMLAYYNETGFSDWTHKRTGAPMLKAQHPEFEMWLQGKHRRAGVACADCHMPKQTEGTKTFSDHQIRSPLLQVDKVCVMCHGETAKDILAMAESQQEKIHDLQTQALRSIVDLIEHIEELVRSGTDENTLAEARRIHRESQFWVDYVYSENSTGFHAPGEAERLLRKAIDEARRGKEILSNL